MTPARTPSGEPPGLPPPRVVIESVTPEIDAGRFPIKRTPGEEVVVEADVFADGHDVLAGVLRYRHVEDPQWQETPLEALVNDRWRAVFTVSKLGRYEYTLEAWVDAFASWRRDLSKKLEAGQEVTSELLEGAALVKEAALRATEPDAQSLRVMATRLASGGDQLEQVQIALGEQLPAIMARHPDRLRSCCYERTLEVIVDPTRARYGAWYEIFPRSCSPEPGRHGTLRDAEARLPYVAEMGFDVVYLPPIHPIGRSFRKGPNNSVVCGPDDPGSPWGIGGVEGGHKSVHPDLGTIEDFDRFVRSAAALGLEVALDIAYQCSPDHPYVREHPDWFRHRPDGTIKYAENPPKKYQDIYPLDFEREDWQALWEELKDVVLFWIGHGVKIFRVDNPHTKSFRFWEWMIREVQAEHPDTIFLSEAFTRPKVMRHLAKAGFSQSYTYFTWRNTKAELTEYLTELTQTAVREYMRPNLFANTPDILHEYLQFGGRAAFQARLVLAATLGASYGIYGPPFELCEGRAVPGTEEYLDSEKYQVRHWDLDQPGNIRDYIAAINRIRNENEALHANERLRFYPVDNEQLIFYGKTTPDLSNMILMIVNLDPHHTQAGWVRVPLDELGLDPTQPYQVHDLVSEARFLWHGEHNYVELNPHVSPAHVLRVRRKIATEQDFDYFM